MYNSSTRMFLKSILGVTPKVTQTGGNSEWHEAFSQTSFIAKIAATPVPVVSTEWEGRLKN